MNNCRTELTRNLFRYSNEVTTTFKETPRTDAENKTLLDLSLRGLQLLSEWTSVVTELYSWKLLHPTDHHQNKECPQVCVVAGHKFLIFTTPKDIMQRFIFITF